MLKFSVAGVSVFSEKRKTRIYVGLLEKIKDQFVFTYDKKYLHSQNIIPLGPELPLTKKQFKSKELFPSFEDRIPSRKNPAYFEYCSVMGITEQENDPLVLLSTIARRGPSSFIFEPFNERSFTSQEVIDFRKLLNLTTREFAQVFEIPQASLNALERKRASGKDLLKRLEIIINFPGVALSFLILNGGILMHDKWKKAAEILKKKSPENPEKLK